jgi:hypothetical protein
MTRGRVLLLFLLVAPRLAVATPVDASCASYPLSVSDELSAASVVFVGTVVNTWDASRSARVRVDSIWKGPRLPAFVDVHGEAPGSGPTSGSSGDRRYQTGTQYLFAPLNGTPPFHDYEDCRRQLLPYTPAVAAYAPTEPTAPDPTTSGEVIANTADQSSLPIIVGALLVAIVSIVVVYARRRAAPGKFGP